MTPPNPPAAPPTDAFRHGWRFVKRARPDGTTDLEQVPLTLEDVLHPQEGDVIPETSLHEMECGYLADVFRSRPVRDPFGRVTADLLVDWGVDGVRNHSPDVGVFAGLDEEPDLTEGTFRLAESGGRCLFVVEIVSPEKRDNDVVHKFREYHQVGVPLYVIVDQERERGPRRLAAYRYTPVRYEEVTLDGQGRLLLRSLGVLLGLRDGRVTCYDAATGAELGDYVKLAKAVESLEQLCREQEQTIEEGIFRAHTAERAAREQEEARHKAEQAAHEQEEARHKAEQVAREQEEARRKAEQAAREQEEARHKAEQRARDKEKARRKAARLASEQEEARRIAEQTAREYEAGRQKAEDRVRELEEMVRRLQEARGG